MSKVVFKVFERLHGEFGTSFPEYVFSTEYLGRSKAYLSWLKTTKNECSLAATVHLANKLGRERLVYEDALKRASQSSSALSSFRVSSIKERIELFDDLSNEVRIALTEQPLKS